MNESTELKDAIRCEHCGSPIDATTPVRVNAGTAGKPWNLLPGWFHQRCGGAARAAYLAAEDDLGDTPEHLRPLLAEARKLVPGTLISDETEARNTAGLGAFNPFALWRPTIGAGGYATRPEHGPQQYGIHHDGAYPRVCLKIAIREGRAYPTADARRIGREEFGMVFDGDRVATPTVVMTGGASGGSGYGAGGAGATGYAFAGGGGGGGGAGGGAGSTAGGCGYAGGGGGGGGIYTSRGYIPGSAIAGATNEKPSRVLTSPITIERGDGPQEITWAKNCPEPSHDSALWFATGAMLNDLAAVIGTQRLSDYDEARRIRMYETDDTMRKRVAKLWRERVATADLDELKRLNAAVRRVKEAHKPDPRPTCSQCHAHMEPRIDGDDTCSPECHQAKLRKLRELERKARHEESEHVYREVRANEALRSEWQETTDAHGRATPRVCANVTRLSVYHGPPLNPAALPGVCGVRGKRKELGPPVAWPPADEDEP
jgi:hypothetical protein